MSLPIPWLDRLAHDLRGPLTPLQTAAYLLKSGNVEAAQQQELFTLIERQTRVMSGMIDELSDWSQANRGLLSCSKDSCDISLLLDIALSGMPGSKGAPPSIVDESDGAMVLGDQIRLVALFRTLAEFAVSRSPDAVPSIHLHNTQGTVRMDIVLNGPVADAGDAAALFEQPLAEPYDGGLGLKLLIGKTIVMAHGGSIAAAPLEGDGLRIRCDLPLALTAAT